jgi:hypothetical protein
MTAPSLLPKRGRGRQSAAAEAQYRKQAAAFRKLILQIRSSMDSADQRSVRVGPAEGKETTRRCTRRDSPGIQNGHSPSARSHPTSVCSFLSGIGGAIRRKRKKRSCVPPLMRRLRPSRRPADARISATEAGAHFRVRCRRALCRACVVQSSPVRGGVVWAPRPDRIGYC